MCNISDREGMMRGGRKARRKQQTPFFHFFLAAETLRSAYSHHQRDVKVVQKLALSASTKALASSLSIFLLFFLLVWYVYYTNNTMPSCFFPAIS